MDTTDVVDPGTAGSCEDYCADYWAQVQTLRADLARLRATPDRDLVGARRRPRPRHVPGVAPWHEGS